MKENELDAFLKDLQSFFAPNTVLVVGSGLSCSEGISGMKGLATELIEKSPNYIDKESNITWGKIMNDLISNTNLEATLLKFKPNEEIENSIRSITTNLIKSEENKIIQKVIKGEQTLKLSKLIKRFNIPEAGLVIITTNYDRLIEIACEIEGIPVDNLFYGKHFSKLDENKSRMSFCEGIFRNGNKNLHKLSFTQKVLIYKPHGCLSWYLHDGNPMCSTFDLDLERLIVTPGANKYRKGYDSPFDLHRSSANEAIENASKFIIIGYGFNDDHLETYLQKRILDGTPTLILTRSLSETSEKIIKGNENVISISHYEDDSNSGSKVYFKNNQYKIKDIHWWDIEHFNRGVFKIG